MEEFKADFECFEELPISVDELVDDIIPAVYPAPVDGVLADEEELLIFGVEGTTDDGITVWFYVFVVFVLQETLINHLLWHLALVYQHISAPIVYP